MFGPNPERYLRMQVPHEDSEAAAQAFDDFCEAVDAAREKFKIADVLIVSRIRAMMPATDGTKVEGEGVMAFSLGDATLAESLAAYAYGHYKRKREEHLAQLLSGNKKARVCSDSK